MFTNNKCTKLTKAEWNNILLCHLLPATLPTSRTLNLVEQTVFHPKMSSKSACLIAMCEGRALTLLKMFWEARLELWFCWGFTVVLWALASFALNCKYHTCKHRQHTCTEQDIWYETMISTLTVLKSVIVKLKCWKNSAASCTVHVLPPGLAISNMQPKTEL